jgi:hypothetical protein
VVTDQPPVIAMTDARTRRAHLVTDVAFAAGRANAGRYVTVCGIAVVIEFPPGDPGTPPHRHSGPAFGYMLEGEMLFELEG